MNPIVVTGLAAAAGAGLVALDRVAEAVVRPRPRPPERSVEELGVAHEDFEIPSGDHCLGAWLLLPEHAEEEGPLVLIAHGWGASYGTMLALAEPLVEAGQPVLLFDVRGHGRNEPRPWVTVRCFRDDVMAAVRYASDRFPGRPLVLIGHSLGGAAAVLAAAEGAEIRGLILIASPSDMLRMTAEYLIDKGMPGNLMIKVLRPFWWRRVGGSFRPHVPWRRIGEIDVPMLILQPENDRRVGRHHAAQLAKAAGVDYELVPGREHTDVLESPVTLELVRSFVERIRPLEP